jgi:predicted nucleic acid-binding protein
MKVLNITDQTDMTLVQAALHKGEAEAIVLAAELHAERLVLDDQDARRFADRCGLKVIGTLGILLGAKQRRGIISLRAEINTLVALGFRVNPQLVTAVLQRARE